jgi:hypothetical protein
MIYVGWFGWLREVRGFGLAGDGGGANRIGKFGGAVGGCTRGSMGKMLAVRVDGHPSTTLEAVIMMGRKGGNGDASQLAVIKLNIVLFLINFPKSQLLQFTSIVTTAISKRRSAYTLVDSEASHCFVDECFAPILGLIPRISGTIIITIVKNRWVEMPHKQV